ncbi:MAG: (d)CMP kinase, partial [Rhodothermales bacterium]
QRRIARAFEEGKGGVVIDGRDIGTVVFPDADLKVFMIADERVRARRRFEELRESGSTATLDEVLRDIRSRDEKDMRRTVAPLRKADDALKLDTSELDIAEQVNVVVQAVKERENLSAV